jgi:hypothetical protein
VTACLGQLCLWSGSVRALNEDLFEPHVLPDTGRTHGFTAGEFSYFSNVRAFEATGWMQDGGGILQKVAADIDRDGNRDFVAIADGHIFIPYGAVHDDGKYALLPSGAYLKDAVPSIANGTPSPNVVVSTVTGDPYGNPANSWLGSDLAWFKGDGRGGFILNFVTPQQCRINNNVGGFDFDDHTVDALHPAHVGKAAWVRLADVDNDGDMDIIVGSRRNNIGSDVWWGGYSLDNRFGSTAVSWFENVDGNGATWNQWMIAQHRANINPPALVAPGSGFDNGVSPNYGDVGDLNGDQRPDIIVTSRVPFIAADVYAYLNGGGAVGGNMYYSTTSASFQWFYNAAGNPAGWSGMAAPNDTVIYAPNVNAPVPHTRKFTQVFLRDLDQDGLMDFITGDISGRIIYWRRTSPANAFTFAHVLVRDSGCLNFQLADADGDGDDDIWVKNKFILLTNAGATAWTEANLGSTSDNGKHILPADFNADGRLDYLTDSLGGSDAGFQANTGYNSSFRIYMNRGGNFSAMDSFSVLRPLVPDVPDVNAVKTEAMIMDFNVDGFPDIVTSGRDQPIIVYENCVYRGRSRLVNTAVTRNGYPRTTRRFLRVEKSGRVAGAKSEITGP